MGLLDGRRTKKIDAMIGKAVADVTHGINDDQVGDDLVRDLMACTMTAGSAISAFLEVVRKESTAKGLGRFIKALDAGADPRAPIRVVAWGYMNEIIRREFGNQRQEVFEVAERSYGVASDDERAVAFMDPGDGTKDSAGAMLRFNRFVYQHMIASLIGEMADADSDLPGIMIWSTAFSESWSMYHRSCYYIETGRTDYEE